MYLTIVIFYFKGCDNSGGMALPENIEDIPCNTECGQGQYLGYESANHLVECLDCPANTYSLGGGMRIDGSLKEWKQTDLYSQIIEYGCADAEYRFSDYTLIRGCHGWKYTADGKYLESKLPDTAENDRFYDLWFKIGVRTVKPGSVGFGLPRCVFNSKRIRVPSTWEFSIMGN